MLSLQAEAYFGELFVFQIQIAFQVKNGKKCPLLTDLRTMEMTQLGVQVSKFSVAEFRAWYKTEIDKFNLWISRQILYFSL